MIRPLSVMLTLALAGCAAAPEKAATAPGAAPLWSYAGPTGPERWSALSGDFAACAGAQQSPVALDAAAAIPARPAVLALGWRAFEAKAEPEGPTLLVPAKDAGGAKLGSSDFALAQFHFHAPSEHAVNGRRAPMEIHFVHRAADGRLLVVGVLVEEGRANPALAALWALEKDATVTIDPMRLLPADREAFAYEGSLTTPPCSEIVSWRVLARPITASAEQIAFFAEPRPDNARPLQALARRFVLKTP